MVTGLFLVPLMAVLCGVVAGITLISYLIEDGFFRRDSFFRKKCISYPLFGLLGLICTPIVILIPLLIPIIYLSEYKPEHSGCSMIRHMSNRYIWCAVTIVVGLLLAPFLYAAIILAIPVAHIASYVILFYKLYIIIRRCWDADYMRVVNYAQY